MLVQPPCLHQEKSLTKLLMLVMFAEFFVSSTWAFLSLFVVSSLTSNPRTLFDLAYANFKTALAANGSDWSFLGVRVSATRRTSAQFFLVAACEKHFFLLLGRFAS
jgi:hypothetical protein